MTDAPPPLPALPSRGRTYGFLAGGVATLLTLAVVLPLALGSRPNTGAATDSLSGNDRPHPLYANGSLLVAQLLGVMGLPHILVRFYTNSDGHTARRTTLFVLCLLGLFYIFPAVHGALGRLYAPRLLMTGSRRRHCVRCWCSAFGGAACHVEARQQGCLPAEVWPPSRCCSP